MRGSSSLPVAIIIVGVGSDDFESMDILDADDVPLYSQKYRKNMEADIVQFVPFREFRNNPAELAKQTLEEVPGQLLNFFKKKGIVPNPSDEAGRKRIQQKLAQARSVRGNQDDEDFFSKRKAAFEQKMVEMGMDLNQVQNFLESKGIPEENPELVLDHMTNPGYLNALKNGFKQQANIHANLQAAGYNYVSDQPARQPQETPQAAGYLPQINASSKPRLINNTRFGRV